MHRLLQLTLDFFDAVPAAPADAQPKREAPRKPREDKPLVAATTPEPRLDEVLHPASFRHPRANREAVLGDSVVAFEFKRSRRRNIGFMVGPEGLTVSAPRWVPLYEVDTAVRSKTPWILKKLGEVHERQRRIESARIEWRDGARFPFLGEEVELVLDPRASGAVLESDAGLPPRRLRVGLPQQAEPSQVRDAVQAWLMRRAHTLFTERLDHYAPLLRVRWKKLALSNAGTRWGTAHSDGTIRLNWRLVHFRLPVIDYVVAHELSHLRVMDHSPKFWDTVASVVPDYEHLRGQLKDEALPSW
ncbi:M48 family metallopeptidase [Ramlibacter sp. PS4R-6]|uniref:M48 family metallopeptidase n=1 Tax=Ramlibacter sp. PS4R-6 TaxID=3133438 RepID=UPI0030AEC24D